MSWKLRSIPLSIKLPSKIKHTYYSSAVRDDRKSDCNTTYTRRQRVIDS